VALIAATATSASAALSTTYYTDLSAALSNEEANLGSLPAPTSQDLKRLRTLVRASGVLTNTTTDDAKALKSLLNLLKEKAFPDYAPLLGDIATNLVGSYNRRFDYVAAILPELPESKDSLLAQKQFKALTNLTARLNAADRPSKVAALLGTANKRLDVLLQTMARALIPIFPSDLTRNTVSAKINGINMRVRREDATDNIFSVTATETNFMIYFKAVDNTQSVDTGARALILSLSNVVDGLVRYTIPDQATVDYHTGVYSGNETSTTATSGSVFVSTEGSEIFGFFTATGPDLTIIYGRFRMDLPTP
jgi:hypothetical protein